MDKELEKKLTELAVNIEFQNYAIALGFLFLVDKRVVDREEFNSFISNAKEDLKSGFDKDLPNPLGLDYKKLADRAFERLNLPDRDQNKEDFLPQTHS